MPDISVPREPRRTGPANLGDSATRWAPEHGPLWRAAAVFRLAALVYAVVLLAMNVSEYRHPVVAWLIIAGMAVWTALTWRAYNRPERQGWPLLVADLVVSAGMELNTPWVVGRVNLDDGAPTLAVAWLAAPVLTWAVAGGRRLGVVAALLLGGVQAVVRGGINQPTTTGAMLMVLAAVAVGHAAHLVVAAQRQLQRAVELQAAARERERLARGIHDSVLQVLAMVRRRGARLDGEAGELARLAGEQEAALRSLIATSPDATLATITVGAGAGRDGAAGNAAWDSTSDLDLQSVLSPYGSTTVTIVGPADPVLLPAHAVREIGKAVGAALDNVSVHCGPDVRAWVLLEDEPAAVMVTVRDDGPGFGVERLAQARAQGRLGVAQSIEGRIRDLGGTTTITSAPGEGTEVELRIPRTPLPRS